MPELNRILLVRHGETRGESSIRFYGRTDVELSEQGESQIRAAARRLPGECFDCVVASPLPYPN